MINCIVESSEEGKALINAYGIDLSYYINQSDELDQPQIQYIIDYQNFIKTEKGININGVGQIDFDGKGKITIGNKTFVLKAISEAGVKQLVQELNAEIRNYGKSYVIDKYNLDSSKLVTKPYYTKNIIDDFAKLVKNTDEILIKDIQATKEDSIASFIEPSIEQEKQYRVEMRDNEGNHVGFFSASMQKDIVDSIFSEVIKDTILAKQDLENIEVDSIAQSLEKIKEDFEIIVEGDEDLDNPQEASKQAQFVLNSWNDFRKLLKAKFDKYGISVGNYDFDSDDNFDSPIENEDGGEDSFKNNYLMEQAEIDPRDTLSKRVKLFLSFLPETKVVTIDGKEQLEKKRNLFGYEKLYDVDKLYQELLHQFANQPQITFKDIMDELEKQKYSKPIFGYLSFYLKKADIQVQKELVTAIRKVNIPAFLTMLEKDGNDFVFRTFEENRNSFEKNLITEWIENQKLGTDLIKLNDRGEYFIDANKVAEYRATFNNLEKLAKDKAVTLLAIEQEKLAKQMIKDLGIKLSDEAYIELKQGLKFLGKGKYSKDFNLQFGFTTDGGATGLFSSLLADLEGTSKAGQTQDTLEEIEHDINKNNPLYFLNDNVKTLAKVEARHNLNIITKGHVTLEGKQVFDFSNASYQWREILKLINSAEERKLIEKDLFGSNAPFYDQIWGNDARRNNYKPGTLAGLKDQNSKQEKGLVRGNMSPREQFITTLTQYINEDKDFSNYIDLTKSDKKVSPIHTGIYKQRITIKDHGKIVKYFNKAINAEIERIKFVQQNGDKLNNAALIQGGKNFYFVHFLNEDYAREKLSKYENADVEKIWKEKGLLNNELTVNTKEVQLLVEEFIQDLYSKIALNKLSLQVDNKVITDQFASTRNQLEKEIAKLSTDADLADQSNIKEGDRLREEIIKRRNEINYLSSQDKVNDTLFEWAINQWLFNVTLSMTFSGDPALFYKKGSTIDETLRKTYAEYGKRQAKDLAPGSSIEHSSRTYSSLVAKVDKTSIDYLKGYSLLGNYKSVDTTDAIQYATVQRYIQLQFDRGRVSSSIYQSINDKIQKSKDDGSNYYDLTNEESSILFGPEKPVEVSKQTISQLVGGKSYSYIVYVKSALFPLVPRNTQNFELDKMRVMMEKNGIDQLYVTSAGKAGNIDKPLEIFKDGKFINTDSARIEQSTNRNMLSDGFLFQQEIPFDEEKEKITFITQLNKLITDTIGTIEEPVFNGLTGLQISLQKESIRKQMIDLEMKSFKDKLGITKSGKVSHSVLRDLLIDQVDTPHEKQSLTINEATGNFITPWLFNPYREGLESKLMKYIKKLIQPKMAGKSFVQASALGITNLDKSGKVPPNIIATQGYKGEQLKMPRPVIAGFNEEIYLTQDQLNLFKVGRKFTLNKDQQTKVRNQKAIKLTDKIIFGHPTIGKTYLKESGRKDFISLDDDYGQEIRDFVNEHKGELDKYQYQESKPQEFIDFTLSLYDRVKGIAEKENKKLFTSNNIILENRTNDFDKVINLNKEEFFNRIAKRNTTYDINAWKDQIDNLISKVDQSKVINTDKYLSDLLSNEVNDNTEFEGLILPAQVLVPFQFFESDEDNKKNKLDVTQYLDASGKIDNSKLPKELLRLVGARIPNQSHSSQLPIEIVGFLPTSMGDTIFVPDGITTQMGSDFDVDKLYVYKPNYLVNEDSIVNYGNSSESLKGLQNQYFETLYTILNSAAMFEKVLKPLDMGDLGQVASELNKDKVYETYHSVTTQLNDYLSNKDAKSGVGFSSLQLTFNSLLQRTENVDFAFRKVVKGVVVELDKFVVKVDDIELNTFSGLGNSEFKDKETGEIYKRTTSDNIIQAQSAFVDHAKEKLVDQINLNSDTSPSWFAFIQAKEGKTGDKPHRRRAINVDLATKMVNSPVVREYINLLNQKKDTFSSGERGNLKQNVIKELASKYEFGQFEINNLFTAGAFTMSSDNIGIDQGETLKLFLIFDELGGELFQTINAFNVDTKGAGTSITESENKRNRLEDVKTTYTYIKNRNELLEYPESYGLEDRQTEIAKVEEATTEFVHNYLAKSLGYDNLDGIMRGIANNKGTMLSLKQQKQIIGEYTKFVFSSSSMDYFNNPQAVRNRLLYGTNSLAHRLQDMKFKYPDFIFRKLQSELGKKIDEPSYIKYDTNEKEFDKELIFGELFQLSRSSNPEIKSFVNDLLLYNYVVQGNRNSPTSFTQLIPPALLNHNDYLNLIANGLEVNSTRFIRQFSQHKPNILQSAKIKGNPSTQTHIQITKDQLIGQPQFIYVQFEKQQYVYEYWNDQDEVLNYFQIGKLGDRYSSEYDFESDFPLSSIPRNQVGKVLNRGMLEASVRGQTINKDTTTGELVKSTLDKTLDALLSTKGVSNDNLQLASLYKDILGKEEISTAKSDISAYFHENHRISIGSYSTLNQSVENILHETSHAFTSRTVQLVNDFPDQFNGKVIQSVKNLEALRKYTIKKLFKPEYYEIQNRLIASRELEFQDRLEVTKQLNRENPDVIRLIYATQNVEEFIAGALTNREFQQALNGLRDTEGKKTLLESLKNWFSEFLTALKESLGVQIRSDSVLNSAVNNAFALIEEYPNLRNQLEQLSNKKNQQVEDINSAFDDAFDSEIEEIDMNLQQSGRVTYTCKR